MVRDTDKRGAGGQVPKKERAEKGRDGEGEVANTVDKHLQS
jgi:hypothetical protein